MDMSQNSALRGKGVAGKERKPKETFLKVNFIKMVFPNIKEGSRESFFLWGFFFSSFETASHH